MRHLSEEGRAALRRSGRHAVESGQLRAAAVLGGKKMGLIIGRMGHLDRARELPQTKAAQSAAGKRTVQQLNNVPARVRRERARIGGLVGGAANVTSGRLAKAREHCDYPRQARWRSHLYWHVMKENFQPKCVFCTGKDAGYV